jgi:hypothetical protein
MGIFGSSNKGPTKLNGVSINQSKQGFAIAALMGQNKIQQSIIWLDGLHSVQASSGGGKGGGKSGGGNYLYTADVIAALCNGPVSSIASVWSGQTWLSTLTSSESTVLTGTTYTPTYSANLAADNGVSMLTTYSGTYNDFGASSSTVLSGTDYTPMKLVPYGTTLTTGMYSINSSTGAYNFSSADVGKPVVVNYQYSLQNFIQQETDLIPSNGTVKPGGANGPQVDMGVVFYNNGTSIDGTKLTAVTTTPTVSGTYKFTSNNSAAPTYQFATVDANKEVLITWSYTNKAAVSSPSDTLLNFELFTGAQSQAVAPYMLTGYSHGDNGVTYFNPAFPAEALGYTNTAYVLYYPMELGSDAELQDNTFEVITPHAFGGGIVDCNPVTCLYTVLTNSVWGLGSGAQPFPVSAIDNGTNGTWGYSSPTGGARTSNSTAWNWFAAQNFFISPVIDSQDTAASIMSKWLEAGMCSAFMSEGLLKLVPYGDTSAAANGCTWVAPFSYVVALDDTCFIAKEGEDPVKIERSAWQDANNKIQVQYKNRANQYSDDILQESDQAAINRYGLRVEDAQNWDFITTVTSATFAANMRLKRSVNIRNTYTFTLPYTYSYLEPMDIVPISTTSVWAAGLNNANLGIVNLPVQITKIVDDPVNGLEITAEDYAYGTHKPVLYNKGISSGDIVINQYANPANSEVVLFEATSRLTGFTGNQIWIGAAGASAEWGGCAIWISSDGAKYTQLGTITTPARLGTLASALPVGSAADTVNSLVVNIADNCGALFAGTQYDATQNNTLCYVDNELISYSACALTGSDQYTMNTYLSRGAMGSTIASHAAGSLFMRLDDSIYKYTYDPQWYGKTLYFKFSSVNSFNNCPQDLATLTAVPFTVPGLNPGTVSASTGIVTATSVVYPANGSNPPKAVSTLEPAEPGADSTANNTAVAIVNPSFSSATTVTSGVPGWTVPTGWSVVTGGVD